MDLDQARRLEDAATLGDVFEDREDLVFGQVGAIQRRALAFGEAGPAGAALEQPILLELAESAGDGEISDATAPEVRAWAIQATEPREVIHGVVGHLERRSDKGS
jgi:hypothetical protein